MTEDPEPNSPDQNPATCPTVHEGGGERGARHEDGGARLLRHIPHLAAAALLQQIACKRVGVKGDVSGAWRRRGRGEPMAVNSMS